MAIPKMSDFSFSSIRPQNRTSDKLIFISCEGSITEWEYFEKIIKSVFKNVSSKVSIINVIGDVLNKKDKDRTLEEKKLATSSDPQNVLEKMKRFIEINEDKYDLKKHDDDEFWIVMDIDNHTDSSTIDANGQCNLDKWNFVLTECKKCNYNYAISNPFFELWLLLHFDDVNKEDYDYAVNNLQKYAPTDHFKKRLDILNVPLKKGKHINPEHYSKYNKKTINNAICRAKELDSQSYDWPQNLGTTVYKLLESIVEIDKQYGA